MKTAQLLAGIAACTLACSGSSNAQELVGMAPDPDVAYSPYLQHDYPDQVLFGDTHLHTAYSADAGLMAATTTPDDAYRFAKGETVISSNGIPARLARPLDWLVVADHAENLGLVIALDEQSPVLEGNAWAAGLAEIFAPRDAAAMAQSYLYWAGGFSEDGPAAAATRWPAPDSTRRCGSASPEAAERHNAPGAFTAFIGYEWTSGPGGNNLHRNVIFRDGKDLADRVVPFSAYDSENPEDLWDWMARYETDTGGQVLAIPHNGNLSNGLMFDDVTMAGEPLSADYATRRMRWEPVIEVTQMKGDGEAHPMLSPDDAFADYGTWDVGSFGAELKTPEMLPREYAREALKRGLAYDAGAGREPVQLWHGRLDGFAYRPRHHDRGQLLRKGLHHRADGRSDPLRGTDHRPGNAGRSERRHHPRAGACLRPAAVWAKENTRAAIWDALSRREVYATTGTRLRVRVFAGASFTADDLARSDFAAHGYANGVPMGGDLTGLGRDEVPGLLIRALRDPDGANLDRVQVIKGWLDAEGVTQERVHDVACADGRAIVDGACDGAVGNTVDVARASYTNAIGDPFLETWWQDPDFDPSLRAFYYVRVIEIPTPRWTTYDAAFFGVDLPDSVPPSHQERAYTSPIWYSPTN